MTARWTTSALAALAVPVCLAAASGRQSQAPPPREPAQDSLATVSGRVLEGDGQAPARFAQIQCRAHADEHDH
jgi:hypothetical protein